MVAQWLTTALHLILQPFVAVVIKWMNNCKVNAVVIKQIHCFLQSAFLLETGSKTSFWQLYLQTVINVGQMPSAPNVGRHQSEFGIQVVSTFFQACRLS